MKLSLRSFVYLDSKLTRDFLSQLDKGYYDKEHISDNNSERTIEQNDNSEFERLYAALQERGFEKTYINTESDWNEVSNGDIVELDLNISINMLNSLFSNPALKAALFASQQIDSNNTPIEAILGNDIAATAKLANDTTYSFLMNLNTEYIRKANDLTGELTVLCKVHRKFKDGETQLALGMPSFIQAAMNKAGSVNELKKSFAEQGLDAGELEVKAPGAVLTPIAVYR